ncbi:MULTISPECIES: dihydroneopterin aldolase [Niveibacterium]|uniref:dihydroneopterin aldolase n=1 Tax=Niveibacterium microcysteis TaxID=2811415 RepID=A0ABX7M379_9RHOO|nr:MULTISPECIES: dihydroneopterin aldolase [Niveibacterium]QSI76222.1 dihydroneopterin aldolase [Niveibacterium microcysteis]
MDFIFVEGLQVEASVGIYEREKRATQPLEINLTFGVPDAAAARDDIADTIDYDVVVDRIRAVLADRHFNLLETLGEFIVDLLFSEFGVPWVRVSIAKMGVMRGVRRVGVFIERGRDEPAPPRPHFQF